MLGRADFKHRAVLRSLPCDVCELSCEKLDPTGAPLLRVRGQHFINPLSVELVPHQKYIINEGDIIALGMQAF